MPRWVRVAGVDDLRSGEGRLVRAEGLDLALFREGNRYYALDDACPHQGASLASGALHGGRVICPLHSWVFDLRTGRCPRDSHDPVATYPARANGEAVEVEIPCGASEGTEEPHVR